MLSGLDLGMVDSGLISRCEDFFKKDSSDLGFFRNNAFLKHD